MLLVAFPDFIRSGKGVERYLALDVLSGSGDFVMGGKGIAVGAEGIVVTKKKPQKLRYLLHAH